MNGREEKSIELWRLVHLRRVSLFVMYLVLHDIQYQVPYVFDIRHSTQLIMLLGARTRTLTVGLTVGYLSVP
jgi:hypothetical protein